MATRKRHRLTHRSIRAARPGVHADGDGLLLQVSDSGAKSWILRTLVHGKRRDVGLGSLSIVSLKQAREKAQMLRKIAREGGDPIAARDAHKRDVTSSRSFGTG